MNNLDIDTVSILYKRVYDIAGTMPYINVILNGKMIEIQSFK